MPDDDLELLRQASGRAHLDFESVLRIGSETGASPAVMREVIELTGGSGAELIRKVAAARVAGTSAKDMEYWSGTTRTSSQFMDELDRFLASKPQYQASKETAEALADRAGIPANALPTYDETAQLAEFLIENNLTWDREAVPYGRDLADLKRRIKLHASGDPQSILYYAYDAYRTPTGDPSASQPGAVPTPLSEDSAPAPARTATGGSRPQGSIAAGMPNLPPGAGQADIPVGQESSPGRTATGGPANPEGSPIQATPIIGLEKGNAPPGQGVFDGPIA